jgi:diguanylate cyclase (GGDEF)-like protein
MNYSPQYATMTFLLVAVSCFIAFDVLGPVDKKSKSILPGARITSVFAMFVGVWSAQVIGLLSIPVQTDIHFELFPLVAALIAGLSLAGLGVALRTELENKSLRRNTREGRLATLVPFLLATVISGELLKYATRLNFHSVAPLSLTLYSYFAFFLAVIICGALVDKARRIEDAVKATALRSLAAGILATGMLLSQTLFYKSLPVPALSPKGYTLSAIAAFDISVTILAALMAIIATWLLMNLLQGRLDAKIRETSEDLQRISDTDSLTGLPNRRCFHSTLEQLIADNPQGKLAMFFMDLDGFKPINDGYGHSVGDQVLKVVATRIRVAAGKATLVARLGGDEFVILFTGYLTKGLLDQYATAIINSVSAPISVGPHELKVTTSVGIAMYPDDAEAARLIACADAAMYRAKRSGKNHHRFYSPAMDDGSAEMVELQREIKEGLEAGQFELKLCPQFSAQDGRVSGVETLMYWNHPVRGVLAPEAFMDEAHQLGLSQKLVKAMLQDVAKIQRTLADAGKTLRISVNFSSLQLKQHQFVSIVRFALTEAGLQSRNLSFELREALVPEDPASAESLVHTLRALGIETSLDEFGKGDVGIAALRRLGVARVRVAAEYTAGALEGTPPGHQLKAIAALIKSLGYAAALRGLENREQVELARTLGVDEIQGPALCDPLSLAELVQVLNSVEEAPVKFGKLSVPKLVA